MRVSAPSNRIGPALTGSSAGRNIISGNKHDGIQLLNTVKGKADNTEVYGNLIGTDITGLFAIKNGGHGIRVKDFESVTIGAPGSLGAISSREMEKPES